MSEAVRDDYFWAMVHTRQTEAELATVINHAGTEEYGEMQYCHYRTVIDHYVSCILEEIRARAEYIKAAL